MSKPNELEMAGFELDGVIADVKLFGGFDSVCIDTLKRIRKRLADYVAQSEQELTESEKASIKFELTLPTVRKILDLKSAPLDLVTVNGHDLSKVTRLEVIDNNGRSYVNWGVDKMEFSYQDDGRTLKIFTNGSGRSDV